MNQYAYESELGKPLVEFEFEPTHEAFESENEREERQAGIADMAGTGEHCAWSPYCIMHGQHD